MASTISRAGHPVVLWNRRREKAERVANDLSCPVADNPAEAVRAADVVITSLADDAALREVYLGDRGVVSGVRSGTVVVDTSTVSPESVIEVGGAVDETGAKFLDCPVSGSVSVVEAGNLTIMAGGDPEVLEEARPVLEAMAARIIHTGARGTGAATKLAVNALVHGLNIALSEALVLAERAGVDRKVAYEVFANGAGGAPFVQYKREAYENPDETPVAFSLDLVQKDLELITGLAESVGAPMAQAATGLDLVRAANAAGFADKDLSALAEYMRGEAG